jgi:hypothetical protein
MQVRLENVRVSDDYKGTVYKYLELRCSYGKDELITSVSISKEDILWLLNQDGPPPSL